jgi:hypothetical protein
LLAHVKSFEINLTISTSRKDLGAIQLDGQIGKIILFVIKLAEIVLGLKEALEDGEASLAMSLAPFLALRIPHFKGSKSSSGHG